MNDSSFTTAELEAFLDELLPPERMAVIEDALRGGDDVLQSQLTEINGRRDAGLHSLGEVWRRRRLTCPTREQLGSFLLGVLDEGHADYVKFHLETLACRPCLASLEDLQSRQSQADASAAGEAEQRRRKYYQSSVGRLKSEE
ncbi:MAG: hypothetical protein AAGF31_05415 [Planctomycetota bacterium]